jgi:hypothetical protein
MMTIEDQLLNEIQAALGGAITPSLTRADPSGLFEGYILGLVLRAAINEGARTPIDYEDVNGNMNPPIFEFRTSPGYIASQRKAYTHAIIAFPNKPILEAHIGIRVEGNSGVLHECDVAVLTQTEATRCRRESIPGRPGRAGIWISPKVAQIVLAVECKFYTPANLGLNLARSFVGLGSDISSRCDTYFVTNTSSQSVELFLAEKGKNWFRDVVPTALNDTGLLVNQFQRTFRNFRTLRKW